MTVDCEQAANLLWARVDGELAAADGDELDAHLAGCAACRAAIDAAELDDAALVRAFAGRREVAAGLACWAAQRFSARPAPPPAGPAPAVAADGPRVGGGLRRHAWAATATATAAAATAAIVGLVLVLRQAVPTPLSRPPLAAAATPVARLVLASGDVFTCPSEGQPWRPAAPGAALGLGAAVRTADAAKCELAMPGGSRVRLNTGTELRLAAAGDVELAGGQIWSAAPPDAAPLRIAVPEAALTATGGPASRVDVSCAGRAARVTVVAGSARVDGRGRATTVAGGESLEVYPDLAAGRAADAMACTPVRDPVAATRWLDDLLLLLPADDPELSARVDALLGRVAAEQAGRAAVADAAGTAADATGPAARPGESFAPGPVERDLRARGPAWAAPVARYAVSHLSAPDDGERDKRRAAARLLADLAPPERMPDLIALLADEDAEVRLYAAVALRRLTGQTLGFSPEQCAAAPRDPTPFAAWRQWWDKNRQRHIGRP